MKLVLTKIVNLVQFLRETFICIIYSRIQLFPMMGSYCNFTAGAGLSSKQFINVRIKKSQLDLFMCVQLHFYLTIHTKQNFLLLPNLFFQSIFHLLDVQQFTFQICDSALLFFDGLGTFVLKPIEKEDRQTDRTQLSMECRDRDKEQAVILPQEDRISSKVSYLS